MNLYPELEGTAARCKIVISMLEEFPDLRENVIQWLIDEHAEELP